MIVDEIQVNIQEIKDDVNLEIWEISALVHDQKG